MKRWLVIASLAALIAAGSAAATPPGSIPFKFSVPAKGHETVYGLRVTGHLPAGTTINNYLPLFVNATNSSKIAKGVLAAAVAFSTGKTSWDVFVVIDASNESGSGAASITGSIMTPPIPNFGVTGGPIVGPRGCEGTNKVLKNWWHGTPPPGAKASGGKVFGPTKLTPSGSTNSGTSTVSDAKCK